MEDLSNNPQNQETIFMSVEYKIFERLSCLSFHFIYVEPKFFIMPNVSPAQIEQKPGGLNYPATKRDLIEYAENNGDKNEEVMKVLKQLPDERYHSPVDVNKAIGKIE